MVFQKPTPFPMSIHDNIAFGIRLYERLPHSELDDRIESALRRAALWDEVKDKLQAERPRPVGWPAAAAVHRPRDRGAAGNPAARRAGLGARPDLDPAHRRTDRRAEARLLHRDCHPQHAAGGAQFPITPPLCISANWSSSTRPKPSSRTRKNAVPKITSPAASAEAEDRGNGPPSTSSRATTRSCGGSTTRSSRWAGSPKASSPRRSRRSSSATASSPRASSKSDAKVDQLERDIDNLAVRLLALRQPMARDLREIVAALKIASDLERICDYAANVAKRSIALNQTPPVAAGSCAAAHGAVGAALGQGCDRRLCRA